MTRNVLATKLSKTAVRPVHFLSHHAAFTNQGGIHDKRYESAALHDARGRSLCFGRAEPELPCRPKAAETKLKKENKSLIIMWMGGGPSHMDLWDLKPGEQTGGEFKPIGTKASGVQISEVLPTVADQFAHLSLVRSLVTNEGSHERGTVLMNTGRQPNPVVQYPALGAVASSLLTSKDLALPGFIGVGGTAQRIGAGFLGMMYAPFTVQNAGQPPQNIAAPASLGQAEEMEERLRRRQRLFSTIEEDFAGRAPSRRSRIPTNVKRPAAQPRRTKPSTRRAST